MLKSKERLQSSSSQSEPHPGNQRPYPADVRPQPPDIKAREIQECFQSTNSSQMMELRAFRRHQHHTRSAELAKSHDELSLVTLADLE